MRKNILVVLLLFGAFLIFSCSKEQPVQPLANKGQEIQSVAKSSNSSYLILGKGNKLPKNLESAINDAGGVLTSQISEIGVAVATSGDPNFSENLSGAQGIRSVVPDLTFQGIDPDLREKNVEADFTNPPISGDDDFFFDLQWGHDAVDAVEAWNAGYRGAGVRVAVLDEGFDMDHPDLAPNINVALSTSFVPGEPVDYLLADPFSHGSHTAGTVAAADNAIGAIGIAPEAELVLVKVLSEILGFGQFSWIINGIVYAANNDADIISMSLSGSFPKSLGQVAAELKNAINRATTYAYQQGTTVIAAAGNQSLDRDHDADFTVLPADGPNVIQVSATAPIGWAVDPSTDLDVFASSYSNYGQSAIDFAAPGGNFVYPGNQLCTVAGLTRPCWVFDFVFSVGSLGSWYWSVGTSMATPHVTGVAAIIIGKNGGDMHPAQVEAALRQSADDLGKPGNDDFYGMGRVNAGNAVQ